MMTSPPAVRTATHADIPAMVSVINAAFAIETFIDGTRTDPEDLAEMMQGGAFLLAYDDSVRLVASVYVEVRGARGYFGMLAVDPSQQGRGLARVLVLAAEDHCRKQGCTAMELTVLSLRPELPPFYRKLGYIEAGTEDFHPSRPIKAGTKCHCIIMSKTI